ncbi:MAG: Ig-like domain-containing protein, partial [Gemmatimonadetes bacterium]|nr:Ig-like domain-containing protein [Gemmatimonadota bacterium]
LGTSADALSDTLLAFVLDVDTVAVVATATAGSAASIAIDDGDGQAATAGTAVAIPPSVIVTDEFSNPVSGASVTFAVASGGGTVDPTTAVVTDANGIAVVISWILGAVPGSNTLTATAAGGGISGNPVTFTATGN